MDGEVRLGGAEQERERLNGRQARAGRAVGTETKRNPLVEGVSEYWEFYEWEGAN